MSPVPPVSIAAKLCILWNDENNMERLFCSSVTKNTAGTRNPNKLLLIDDELMLGSLDLGKAGNAGVTRILACAALSQGIVALPALDQNIRDPHEVTQPPGNMPSTRSLLMIRNAIHAEIIEQTDDC